MGTIYSIAILFLILAGACLLAFVIDMKRRIRSHSVRRYHAAIKRLTDVRKPRGKSTTYNGKPLMSGDERKFFSLLTEALPHCHIFPEISFGAIMEANRAFSKNLRDKLFYGFGYKRADFVVCLPHTFEIVAIIELDDTSHDPGNDAKRDILLANAGYRVERFWKDTEITVEDIQARFPVKGVWGVAPRMQG